MIDPVTGTTYSADVIRSVDGPDVPASRYQASDAAATAFLYLIGGSAMSRSAKNPLTPYMRTFSQSSRLPVSGRITVTLNEFQFRLPPTDATYALRKSSPYHLLISSTLCPWLP